MHVTLKIRDDVPRLRNSKSMRALLQALHVGCERLGVRITNYSIQYDHIHLICEAQDAQALTRGIMGLEIRMAHALNRAYGRSGPVWADRYHVQILRSPTQVRRCLVYVLGNWRHHGGEKDPLMSLDACSSALWFDGYREKSPRYPLPRGDDTPIAEPTTWLLRVGWRKLGLISVAEGAWN